MPPGCFFVVGIGSKWRYDAIFSLHNFCWAGNGYFSSQTVFTDNENIFSKKKPIRPTLAWTLAPKTPRDPLFLLLSMIIGVIKIVELCSDFSYGPWFKRYAQKNEGSLAAP